MLVQFSVGNFLSIRDVATLSMVASTIREHKETNVFQTNKNLRLLKSAVIYGANASGKSNFFQALRFMARFIRNSSKEGQVDEEIAGVESFRLSTKSIDEPSFFEVVLIHNEVMYRYGFELDYKEVKSEWLFYTPKKDKEYELFQRNGEHFDIDKKFKEGEGLDIRTRNNALFLSVVANFKGEISTQIIKWFGKLNVISGLQDDHFSYTRQQLKKASFKDELLDLMKVANLGIEDIEIEDEDNELPKPIEELLKKLSSMHDSSEIKVNKLSLNTLHKKFDEDNRFIGFEKFLLFQHESEGTRKLISLLGPIIDSLKNSKVLVVDELDAKLHPLLTKFIIQLFNSNEYNNKNAQLIFNSHDTNLLSKDTFRRDQIWFTEKDQYGATDLYSLVDYKVRNDASYEKDYLLGKYGSIPYIGTFQFIKNDKEGVDIGE